MKRELIILSVAIGLAFASCGGNETKTETDTSSTEAPKSMVETPAAAGIDGKAVYAKTCQACHQENGAGIPKTFPPLAKSDLLNSDVNGAIDGVLNGRKGEITVNGEKYNTEMAPLGATLNDGEIAAALTYVYSQWENNNTVVTEEMVKARRK